MAKARKVAFTEEAAKRIGAVVKAVEGGNRDMPPVRFRATGDDTTHRLCKTTSTFTKGTVATLNVWEDGTPPSETQTTGATVENVVNKYATIAAGKWVSVALHGNGRWYVVAAECG